jgi:hypothetical protein
LYWLPAVPALPDEKPPPPTEPSVKLGVPESLHVEAPLR